MRVRRHRLTPSQLSRRIRLSFDHLEDRLTPSWGSIPPAFIPPPAGATAVVQNGQGDASGSAAITANEVDWYKFTAASSGTYVFQATPGGTVDTVAGLYSSTGGRLAFNDDISTINRGSKFSATLLSGRTYYLGVTNYTNTAGGKYDWSLDGPTPTTTSQPPPPSSGGTTSTGPFDIRLITSGLTATQQQIFEQAAQKWESIITAALPAATYNGMTTTGVIINASAVTIDGRGGILGQAGPDRFRMGSSLPYHGTMQFDSADLASLQSGGGLLYTVEHELGHILGIGTLWTTKRLLSGASTTNPLFIGTRATAEYNALFGTHAVGVPVENGGGSGTRNAHWRETTFNNELMTGYLNGGTNPLSRITVASLADLGYAVDMTKADSYSRPGSGLLSGGSGGGGGPALRALPGLSGADLVRQIAADVVKSETVLTTLASPPKATAVQSPARATAGVATKAVEQAQAAVARIPARNQVKNEAAMTADAVFGLITTAAPLSKPLVV